MLDDFKEAFSMVLAIALGTAVVTIAILVAEYFSIQQRQSFFLKCITELGDNNSQFCSSIVK